MKLRGFVHDAGGEVVESLPGLVRVRLGGRAASGGGPLTWFGLRKSSSPLDVELHLRHADPTQPSRLTVNVLFRPSHPTQLADDTWKQRCNSVFMELRSYLMGHS
jgi:serine/threonine-protein kinase